MLEPPKDLPPLNPPATPKQAAIHPAVPDSSGLVVKTEKAEAKKSLHLPTLEVPKSQEIIISPEPATTRHEKRGKPSDEDLPDFDEAIKNIHKNMMMITSEEPGQKPAERQHAGKEEPYYSPQNLGEGYFAEIQHYIKNKDAKEIMEDILKKDFLTGMKDYHAYKAQGKPYFIHSKDLEEKLERKMHAMMEAEEEWHELKSRIESEEEQRRKLEQSIDSEANELKALFRQIKANQILEKEANHGEEFVLRGGQRLKSLNDLRKALTYMKDDEFSGHANQGKNDFANWARHALGMPDVAEKIRNAGSAKELEDALNHILD